MKANQSTPQRPWPKRYRHRYGWGKGTGIAHVELRDADGPAVSVLKDGGEEEWSSERSVIESWISRGQWIEIDEIKEAAERGFFRGLLRGMKERTA